MCFSAQVWADYRKYVRKFGADIDIKEFLSLFRHRQLDAKIKIPKAMARAFTEPLANESDKIIGLIKEYDLEQATKLEKELFSQRTRKANAERILQTKTTKKATDDVRIATDKIEKTLRNLADLRRTEVKDRDSRIFPGFYAPVMILENGRRTIKPMRYQCRIEGKPASYDNQYPGTYNARRDNLERFWKPLFGKRHGIMVVNAFYENVSRHRLEQRDLVPGEKDQNVVLEFKPTPPQEMFVACLWSTWKGADGEELLSFAAITDEPPAEVAAAGHDRCIIPIKPENLDAWLNPNQKDLVGLYDILDDRQRPYYEHRMAA